MTGPPPRGHVRLYSAIRPALDAGKYSLNLDQSVKLTNGTVHNLDGHTQQLELVAPRYRMSGTELYSLFPPPNAEGPFTNRFAQAVLKRRTLPWERRATPGTSEPRMPWMALIVLAKGEGTFKPDLPVSANELADYRASIKLSAAAAASAGTCDVLDVSGRVTRKAFPTKRDLPYLTHVREVNLLDSEDANLLDDDGFVSVVASSRVLRGGQEYGAYLVSLEGQLDVLPAADPQPQIGPATLPPTISPLVNVVWSGGSSAVDAATATAAANAFIEPNVASATYGTADTEAIRQRLRGWDLGSGPQDFEDNAILMAAEVDRPAVETTEAVELPEVDFVEGDLDRHRFPVLAHWTFRTIKNGDFESLMRNLDVGLMSTIDEQAEAPPTVLGTGHTLLERHARSGERTTCWYRGPLVPHELTDRDDVPLHAAEQAIRIGRDGIEDLSYAAGFEVGRLMALADPRFVGALIGWRRQGSTRGWGRLKQLELDPDLLFLDELERYASLGVVEQILGGPTGLVDPLGPLINPVPLRELYDHTVDAQLLSDLGLDAAVIEDVLGVAVTPSGLGSATVDTVDLIDTSTFRDVASGAAVDLVSRLAAGLDAAWSRSADNIADMGG